MVQTNGAEVWAQPNIQFRTGTNTAIQNPHFNPLSTKMILQMLGPQCWITTKQIQLSKPPLSNSHYLDSINTMALLHIEGRENVCTYLKQYKYTIEIHLQNMNDHNNYISDTLLKIIPYQTPRKLAEQTS